MIIAVSGVDGAGKSTVVSEIATKFSATSRVALVSAGRPQTDRLERLRSRLRKSDNNPGTSRKRKRSRVLRDALPAVLLGWMRLRLSRRARKLAAQGTIVVSDRWPTVAHGQMDGPRIDVEGSGLRRMLLQGLARLESDLYRRIAPADLAFILTVSVETAIARNDARDKDGKESREDIIRRHQENAEFVPIARNYWHLENEGSLEDILGRIEALIAENRA